MAMVSEGSTDVNTTCSPVRPMDHFVERFEDSTYKSCIGHPIKSSRLRDETKYIRMRTEERAISNDCVCSLVDRLPLLLSVILSVSR
jgi:hypothetical protein